MNENPAMARLLISDQNGLHWINLANVMPLQITVCHSNLCQAPMIALYDPAFLKHCPTIVEIQHIWVTPDRQRQCATHTLIAVLCWFADIHD